MTRKRSKSLSSLNIQSPSTPFRHERVVCYQLYFQEQKARLGSLYPFLTQEQINLRIKEKWKHLENGQKLNYTKAVLCTTPLRKHLIKLSYSKPEYSSMQKKNVCVTDFEASSLMSGSPSSVVSSQEKVQDWLNDTKQRVHDRKDLSNSKKYDGTQYALNYGIPQIIEETISKATGILKNNENSSKGKIKSKQNSRVSFSPRSRKTNNKPIESKRLKNGGQNGQFMNKQKKTLIRDKDVFDFEEIEKVEFYIEDEKPMNFKPKSQCKSYTKSTLKNKNFVRQSSNVEDCDYQQNKQDQQIKSEFGGSTSKKTFISPENVKKKKSLNKHKSQFSEYENDKETCNKLSSKQVRPQKDTSILISKHKHQTRTDTPIVKQRLRPRHKNIQDNNSQKSDSLTDDHSTDSLSFYQNRKGLLVGPILYGNNEHMPAEMSPTNSDDHQDYYTNKEGLLYGPIITKTFADSRTFIKDRDGKDIFVKDNTFESVSQKNKITLVDDVFPKQTKTYTQQQQRTLSRYAQKKLSTKSSDTQQQKQSTFSDVPKRQRTTSTKAHRTTMNGALQRQSLLPNGELQSQRTSVSQKRLSKTSSGSSDAQQRQTTISSDAPRRKRKSCNSDTEHYTLPKQRKTSSDAQQRQTISSGKPRRKRKPCSDTENYVHQKQRKPSSDAQLNTHSRQRESTDAHLKTSSDSHQKQDSHFLYPNGKSIQLKKHKDKNKNTEHSAHIVPKLNCAIDNTKLKDCTRMIKDDATFPSAYFDTFQLSKPLSPVNSIEWEDDLDSQSSVSIMSPQMSQSKTTLAKVLSRMQQITSPNQISLEYSPRLLSPTLSGISELSSISDEPSNQSDNSLYRQMEKSKLNLRSLNLRKNTPKQSTISELSSVLENSSNQNEKIQHRKFEERDYNLRSPNSQKRRKQDTVLEEFSSQNDNLQNCLNLRSLNSQNNKRKPRHGTVPEKITTMVKRGKNLLCDMFGDLTPNEKKMTKSTERRLVASNKEEKMHNFLKMFEETKTDSENLFL